MCCLLFRYFTLFCTIIIILIIIIRTYTITTILFFPPLYIHCCYIDLTTTRLHSHSVYVGQVDYMTTPEELLGHFEACGTVERVTIVCDKYTGKPKGRVQYITIVYYIYHNLSFFSVKRIIISSFLIPLSLSLSLSL